jgi:predicted anti-sigma-YlaC factor YlaD
MNGTMDDRGHESLTQAILAKTSGSGCEAARGRLCDFVDGALAPLDRDLVSGHLDHCPSCAGLAAALAEATAVLPSFAALAPRVNLVAGVLAVTSRRAAAPTVGDRVAAWLAGVAERPRFSLEVAYVLTVLLLVVLGNPVDAFKDASARVQPRVNVVAAAINAPIDRLRAAGEKKLASVERVIAPEGQPVGAVDTGRAWLWQWWKTYVDAPIRAALSTVSRWATDVVDAVWGWAGGTGSEPSAGRPR